jgi:arginine-tRNA-protein transferase
VTARLLQHIVEAPRPCSYLDDRLASLEHRILVDSSADELEALFVRGWRRFGPDHFRPRCRGCSECVPTRIPTATFRPTRSQRTAARRCTELLVAPGPPRVDRERVALYHAWHAARERVRGWSPSPLDLRDYRLQFAFPHPAAREVAYYEPSGRLVGVGICDETQNTWSAAYFFYSPDVAHLSLGVANVLFQIEIARELGIPHVYLGYRIDGCASMAYKARYGPQERLVGWPADDEEPRWVLASST